ncbi:MULTISPECIES: bifunctional glutamate N-acetyltransferase/amino-acid acetyltransferase ArgJ [unclassified Lentilitoribacter]|jgi:glutamate N-acetyltransferase/amino-acid N-acetyltransferase|uniref:bifunctional glutamate N-acetyltransferase/amino-acid acetyltransferase ArgJ n=1 Tax=unclassified Lentilitoribacter TaxID=2647570 RepID=UPI0013A6F5F3|nr:bifunctional glutamate N-acetyltransferase/amino-acid acetyltransferase ArgJ [Lentilitoribacter sp. Alg239-R112]
MKVSPLAPKKFAELPPIAGVKMQTIEAGIKYSGRDDVLLMTFDTPASVAGVFTKSKCASAPVDFCQRNLSKGVAKALVVNSGNANAFTGVKGADATRDTAQMAANAIGCTEDEIYLASTGVIGEPLDAGKFAGVMDELVAGGIEDNWLSAAKAIMTTDTYPKVATITTSINGEPVTINGIAKGSGMIMPDMATMLSFIVTDANIPSDVLQSLLSIHVDTSFNAITVDSDTSTSDTVLLFATGAKGDKVERVDDTALESFSQALRALMHDLSMQIVRDGEGATKHVEIHVTGASSDQSAKVVGLSIANSPLVKTAIAGEDANWGRVVMAVGKAGEEADRDRIAIWFGDVRVAVAGERDPDYSEDEASLQMKGDEIYLKVDLGIGSGQAKVWTCDLTKEYVAINGDYRS